MIHVILINSKKKVGDTVDQEKIGKKIKQIRQSHHLTQAAFAKQFGVTYQAVSKWENGKNIPDISILTQICDYYHLDINEFLTANANSKKNGFNKKKILITAALCICTLIVIFAVIELTHSHDQNFEFKTLSTNCGDFEITGSIAYNDNKTVIYISHVTYCGQKDTTVYKQIDCSLYESDGALERKVDHINYQQDITLEDFLQRVSFNVESYDKMCKNYTEDSLHLEIDATDAEGNTTSYKVPLILQDSCSNT